MRGDVPVREMIANQKHWMARLGMRLLAKRMLRPWKFEEAFFRESARRFRESLSLPLILLGGINRLETMEAAVAEGFEFLAVGRALIRDPDLVARMQTGDLRAGRCSHCNLCMVEMERGGTRCVERFQDGDVLET